jgi:hypothetical protein
MVGCWETSYDCVLYSARHAEERVTDSLTRRRAAFPGSGVTHLPDTQHSYQMILDRSNAVHTAGMVLVQCMTNVLYPKPEETIGLK